MFSMFYRTRRSVVYTDTRIRYVRVRRPVGHSKYYISTFVDRLGLQYSCTNVTIQTFYIYVLRGS